MTSVDLAETALPGGPVEIAGAVELRRTPTGLRPVRLPAWATPQIPDGLLGFIAETSAGVRVRLRTPATAVDLMVAVTRADIRGSGPVPAAFDLRVDGAFFARQPVTEGGVVRIGPDGEDPEPVLAAPQVIRFDGLPAAVKDVEIWLPHTAQCDLIAIRADAPTLPRTAPRAPLWVHHGSSISQCVEAEGPTGTWPAVAATEAGLDLVSLGFCGNAMLDPFVARTIRDLPADLISLKVGANIAEQATMRLRTFLPAVHGFLDTVRERHPHTPIVVVSPIACPDLEEHPGPVEYDRTSGTRSPAPPSGRGALTLGLIREHLANLVSTRAATGEPVRYLDGRALLGPDEVDDLHDGLHPSAAAYLRMGSRFAAHLRAEGLAG